MSSEADCLDTSDIKSPVCQANRITQSIDLAPPPRVSTQSICVHQTIWLSIFCCLQAGILLFSSFIFFLPPPTFVLWSISLFTLSCCQTIHLRSHLSVKLYLSFHLSNYLSVYSFTCQSCGLPWLLQVPAARLPDAVSDLVSSEDRWCRIIRFLSLNLKFYTVLTTAQCNYSNRGISVSGVTWG